MFCPYYWEKRVLAGLLQARKLQFLLPCKWTYWIVTIKDGKSSSVVGGTSNMIAA
jgi:hypothetical protein